jgi:hypothetical protein
MRQICSVPDKGNEINAPADRLESYLLAQAE